MPDISHPAGKTVLLVEDEFLIRMMIAEELAEAGYRMLEASDGPSALELLASHTQIDLLITDVGLPNGMSGHQLAASVHQRISGIRILFISGHAHQLADLGDLPPGNTAILPKPFTMPDISAAVAELLAR